jgi:signal transduction histidine kinase
MLRTSTTSPSFVAHAVPARRDSVSKLAVAESVAAAMSDATVVVDAFGYILRFSAGFAALWELEPKHARQLTGMHAIELLATTLVGSDERIEVLRRAQNIGEPTVFQLQLRSGRVLEARLVLVSLEEGMGRAGLWALRDITESRSQERELRAAKERAERQVQAMRDVLANINHELRNPLNVIIGFGRVLERTAAGALSEKQHKYLAGITESGERMLRLVDDLVELRAVQDASLRLEAVDVSSVARDIAVLFEEAARSRGIKLAVRVPNAPVYARANRSALLQALTNLLSNALQFTPDGGEIEVSMAALGPRLELAVRDSGCGIAPEHQPHLFDYVERVGAKHEHHMKGSGIGLALVKALVAKQGGAISVASELGQGSVFKIALDAVT